MRHEAFALDGRLAVLQPGGDMDLVAGLLGGAGHGQAMRQEIPVLGDDIEDAGGHRRGLVSAPGALRNSLASPATSGHCLAIAVFAPFRWRENQGMFCFG